MLDLNTTMLYHATSHYSHDRPSLTHTEFRPFALHVAAAFNIRSKEMDTLYLRLALFLDARFKTCVSTVDKKWDEILKLVC